MNLFQTCYDLIVQYVFAGQGVTDTGILADQMQHLVATLFSTVAWVFIVAIPFILVYKLICFVASGCNRW